MANRSYVKKKTKLPLRLRAWRKYRKLTQTQLAELSGVTQGMISQLESGSTDYTGETLFDLATALRCRPTDLIERDPEDPEGPYATFEGLSDEDRRRAIEVMRGLKRASDS